MSKQTSIADLLPPKRKVEISGGKYLEIRGLSTEELVKLGAEHKQIFIDLFAKKGLPDYAQVIATTPQIAMDAIAMASETIGQEDAIKRIPAGPQALLLQAIWEETFPDPKAVLALFEWMAKGMRSVEKAMPALVAAQSLSNSGLPSQSITSSPAATH